MTLTRTSFPRIAPHIGKRRLRLVICLGLYGSALGASSLLVSFMARTRYPIEPEYLQFVPSVILSGAGWITGAVISGLVGDVPVPAQSLNLLLARQG